VIAKLSLTMRSVANLPTRGAGNLAARPMARLTTRRVGVATIVAALGALGALSVGAGTGVAHPAEKIDGITVPASVPVRNAPASTPTTTAQSKTTTPKSALPAGTVTVGKPTTSTPASALPQTTTTPAGALPKTTTPTTTPTQTTPASAVPITPTAGSTTVVVTHKPKPHATRLSTGALALAILAALLALGCFVWGLSRWLALEPRWTLSLMHSFDEAGFRASATWAEFADWTRIGR
jgi:hypothetical protein